MFFGFVDQKSNKNQNTVDQRTPDTSFTQISEGTKIKASLKSNNVIRIAGLIIGDVESDEKIIITSTGELKGECFAPVIEISGKIDGKVFAKENLVLNGTSVVVGEIFAKRFVMNEGAYIDGGIKSGSKAEEIKKEDVLDKVPVDRIKSEEEKTKDNSSQKGKETEDEPTAVFKESKKEIKEITAEPIISGTGSKPSANRIVSNVLIGVPGSGIDKSILKEVKDTAGNFMEALGFTFEIYDVPKFEPFYQHLTYVMNRKDEEEKRSLTEIFNSGKKALEDAFLNRESNLENKELAASAIALKNAIEKVDELSVTLGGLILVKVSKDGSQTISAELISPELHSRLKKDPKLVLKPEETYSFLKD